MPLVRRGQAQVVERTGRERLAGRADIDRGRHAADLLAEEEIVVGADGVDPQLADGRPADLGDADLQLHLLDARQAGHVHVGDLASSPDIP